MFHHGAEKMDFVDLPLELALAEKMNQFEYSMPLKRARALIPCNEVKTKNRNYL